MMPPPLPELQPFQGFVPPRLGVVVCDEAGVCTIHEKLYDLLVKKSRQCITSKDERII